MAEEYVLDENNPLRLKRAKPEEDETEEEQNLEEQLLEQDIEGNKKRRYQKDTKVDTTQYNDDSSDEDYEPQVPTKEVKKDDSDSDMFASDDEEENKIETKTKIKKPKVEFLDVNEFERDIGVDQGQDDTQGEEDDEDDEEFQAADYYNDQENEHITKRPPKKEPKIDAFNLKQEQSEGRFDIDGNFIPADDSGDELDNDWLNGIKKKDIKEAKKAQEKREELQKERQKKKEALATEELLFNLITLLQPVETPMEALQRLNKAKPKKKSKKEELTDKEKEREEVRKSTVVSITEYCESLIENGFNDIYEQEKEDLMLKYKEESGKQYLRPKVKEDEDQKLSTEAKSSEARQWEFRWVGDDKIHGPYGAHEMDYWRSNYFQDRVEVREFGTSDFIHVTKVSQF